MSTWTITDSYDETILSGTLKLLAQEWWTKHRNPRDVEASLRASQLVFTATSDGEVVGTARVLTDFTYLATVLDVISSEARRGEGVGAAMMGAITSHPRLQDVDSIELICQPELQAFTRAGDSRATSVAHDSCAALPTLLSVAQQSRDRRRRHSRVAAERGGPHRVGGGAGAIETLVLDTVVAHGGG